MYIYYRNLSGSYSRHNEGLGELSINISLLPRFAVFSLPKAATKVPNDQTLLAELGKIKTDVAKALGRAFSFFGKPKQFEESLLTALRAVPLPGEDLKRYEIYLARLGAEAFILGISVGGNKRFQIGFVDHPSRLQDSLTSLSRKFFYHFAIRRLLITSSSASTSEAHRRVLDRGAALFATLHSELAREYRLVGIPEDLLVSYRRLLVAIIWKHYQRLMDHLLEQANSSKLRFADMLKELDALFKIASITLVHDKHATVQLFHTGSGEFRDYFSPSNRTDIRFIYFSKTARPQTESEPNIPFQAVVRRRRQQIHLLDDLQKRSLPNLPPRLNDSASWQVWVRKMWDGNLKWLHTDKRMAEILKLVEQYFEAFTAHVPHDLSEGCSEKNYLTRSFPRAITGSQVHDCAVYALRWIHILGRLFDPKSLPTGIKQSRIFLVEMPGHVGAMIRLRKMVGDDILVSINNKYAKIHAIDPAEDDKVAAMMVVQDQYQGMKTPFVVRRITASPSNGKALWKEVCRIFDKKLRLPYSDKSEPHLRYLAYNAGIALISRQFTDTVGRLWLELQQRLAVIRSQHRTASPDRVKAELKQYFRAVEKAVQVATDQYTRIVNPLISEINKDLLANKHRLPVKDNIAETALTLMPWQSAWLIYRKELEKAVISRNISGIHPDKFFPDDDFVAAVQ